MNHNYPNENRKKNLYDKESNKNFYSANQFPETYINSNNINTRLSANCIINNKNTSINQVREKSAKSQYSAVSSNQISNNNQNKINENYNIKNNNSINNTLNAIKVNEANYESQKNREAELSNKIKAETLQELNTKESKKSKKIILNAKNNNIVIENSINNESKKKNQSDKNISKIS